MSGDKVLDMVASHFDELSKTLSNMAQALKSQVRRTFFTIFF